jgi:hypothetical protein
VSTFAPPPKRVGNIPGPGPATRVQDEEEEEVPPSRASARTTSTTAARPPPPLPTRSQSSVSESVSPLPRAKPTLPPKATVPSRPAVSAKPTSPVPMLPPRRESATAPGPGQDETAPNPPARESSYGQLRNAFGTAMDSTQVNDLRNSLRKPTSSTATPKPSTSTTPKVNMQDARTASGLAQKYRTDPKSMTFSDAKAGLNVANKILPPSTDKSPPNRQDAQTAADLGKKWNKDPKSLGWGDLKAGYAVANKFRPEPTSTPAAVPATVPSQPQSPPPEQKYGVNDLKSRFANVTLGGMKPPVSPSPPSPQPQQSTTSRPKPPPPPKPKFPNGSPKSPQARPPLPLHSKPPSSTKTTQSSWVPTDIPLNFETQWYCADPMQQIPYLAANPNKAISSSSVSASGSGSGGHLTWSYTAIFAIRWTTDLSRTFIRVTWNSTDPKRSVQARQKHLPPPAPLSSTDLEKAAGLYGDAVVRFCELNLGRQVGNGECWTLAHDALVHVRDSVNPRVMVSNGTIHGQCIYQRDAGMIVSGRLEDVRRGDVVQYLECKFERRQGGRIVYASSAGAPDHTSYIFLLVF